MVEIKITSIDILVNRLKMKILLRPTMRAGCL